jgi:RNA-binding protein 26
VQLARASAYHALIVSLETSTFIDTLFTALRTKSYVPYSALSPPATAAASSSTTPQDGGIPIPFDALMTSDESESPDRRRKRSHEYDDSDLRPTKGPRLHNDGQLRHGRGFSRERGGRMMMSGRADYMDGGMNGAMEMGMGSMMNGRGTYRPPDRGRGICRDYHSTSHLSLMYAPHLCS